MARTGTSAAARRAVVVAQLLLLVVLGGCGVAQDPLEVATTDLASSARSASMALDLARDGRTLHATARTQLDDALQDGADALREVAATPTEGARRDVQHEVLRHGADVLALLRRAAEDEPAGAQDETADRLDRLAARLDDLGVTASEAGS